MSVWGDLVGQERAVEVLRRAVAGERHAMTHAWLVTGPPGSGRSNAAKAFAAALQCERGGCGECNACRTALSGAHPDVTLVRTEQLSIGVDEVRDLVRRAAMSPTLGRAQVLVVEDADRITERGGDALLKAIEEPAARTVWVLCAPTPDDVIVTIRSRCRRVELATPSEASIATLLEQRDGVPHELAAHAARVAQGHIGRARAIARNEDARRRRSEILRIPAQLTTLGACLQAASSLSPFSFQIVSIVLLRIGTGRCSSLKPGNILNWLQYMFSSTVLTPFPGIENHLSLSFLRTSCMSKCSLMTSVLLR